ncbi:unnamed protein product [Rotaria magnacalcarata]|uniref:Beta-hexosaminidase n=4 Tax=Rotaria magnacalcarata TaxID=392030 RepID=A0A816E786_9BILA|nr:unnamed protein product [Rotaria magnacalcarata]
MQLTFIIFTIYVYIPLAQNIQQQIELDEIAIKPTVGEPWPKPQSIQTTSTRFAVHPATFYFLTNETSQQCDLLRNAFDRYYKIIFFPQTYMLHLTDPLLADIKIRHLKETLRNVSDLGDVTLLKRLIVNIEQPCEEWPSLESNESYTLVVKREHALLDAASIWGALRGLETFSQLIYPDSDLQFTINETTIYDFPRFQHRGFLLDTGTHFISQKTLKINLEAMAQSKMNVFHFHIVDDQSFPYDSITYPELSGKGAFDRNHIYSQADIAELLEFARQRGIRVFIEFDSPAHSRSWGRAYDILTQCYSEEKPNNKLGPMDPSRNTTFEFLKNFFHEVAQIFPDRYIHLGADEVYFDCWESNPSITQFMRQMEFGTNYSLLEQYFMQTLINIVNATGKNYVVWQDIIDNNVTLQTDTVVEEPYPDEMARVTKLGYKTLLSSCWYLNLISYGDDWHKYYKCDPYNFTGTEEQKKLVMGGEACMWGEYVDSTNVISSTWPRAAAPAERLWSSVDTNDVIEAAPRLAEHRCRYLRRGIPAAPVNGPGYCPTEYSG